MKKLLIVGIGGVGSFLARNLYEYDMYGQIPNLQITLGDGDEVDLKNLPYQNFVENDLLENKAKVTGEKYNFLYRDKFLEVNDDLNIYDAIICATDGTIFRRQFFKFIYEINKDMYWIDLRSTGKTVAAYCKNKRNTYDYMMSTIPMDDVADGSCQLSFELDNNIVQGGNRIIAEIGAQLTLNWYRGFAANSPPKFIYNF